VARINVKATVTAPQEINIPLVRADHSATSNIFRVFFEVFLSLFSTLLGYILGLANPSRIHWVFLAVTGVSAAAFAISSFIFARKAHKV
jgi:hypothetical protein